METESRFDGQNLVQTTIRKEQRTYEMTFEDAKGGRHVLSLPIPVAVGLKSVLSDLESRTKADYQGAALPEYQKMVDKWKVDSAAEFPLVHVFLNDEVAHAFPLDQAKKFWRAVREVAEIVERRPKQRHS